tara:strand:+ start:207 stop:551 length:345 start_codon:yes stop_codon:yes gene_type:complete
MDENGKLKNVVTNWITIDEKIKDLSQQLKNARNEHKLATTELVSIMQSKDISGLQLNNNAKLVYSVKKIKTPLSKKMLLTGLADYFDDEEEVKKVVEELFDKRTEKTMAKIERK